MNHSFNSDRSKLIITIDDEEHKLLSEMEDLDSDNAMYDFFDGFIANSEFNWLNATDTGDLTNAPILGLLGEETVAGEGFAGPYGYLVTGQNGHEIYACPILERWGFADYQVESVLGRLKKGKKVVFSNNW